jgi:hypothetical protein
MQKSVQTIRVNLKLRNILTIIFTVICLLTLILHDDVLCEGRNDIFNKIPKEITEAIVNKDIETLMSYAMPDHKKIVSENFSDKASGFYKAFFDEKNSYRSFLMNSSSVSNHIYMHKDAREYGTEVSIFFYDTELIKEIDKLSLDELREVGSKGRILEFYFFYVCEDSKCRWYMNFSGIGYHGEYPYDI